MKKHNICLSLLLHVTLFSCHPKQEIEPVENNYSFKTYKLDDEPTERKIGDTINSETKRTLQKNKIKN
jgi:hypothetical protein